MTLTVPGLTAALIALAVGVTPSAAAGIPAPLEFTFDGPGPALPEAWRPSDRQWRVADGALCVDATGGESYVLLGEESWQNFEIEVTATFDAVGDDARWLAVVFRASVPGEAPWSQVATRFQASRPDGVEFAVRTGPRKWSVRQAVAAKRDKGGDRLGEARRLRVVVRGTSVQAYLDGRPVIDSAFCVERATGRVGLAASGCKARFDNVRVRLLPPSPKYGDQPMKPCEIVAHRGFSAVAPENTLAAIGEAIRAGATGCEFDVYASQDAALVLMHDATVNRTTNGRGKITELTLSELKRLDAGSWKAAAFAREPVPTLGEALARLKGTGCAAVIEVKMEGISSQVVEAVRSGDMLEESAVISFHQSVVRDVRGIEPRLPCAWLCSKQLSGTPAQRARWLAGEAARCGTNLLDLDFHMLSEELIAELHKRGITVWAWTVDDPAVMEALMRWGVDSITTNRPDLMVGLLRHTEQTAGGG